MENKRESWGSNIGFLLAAIGSAVGLGNIWGFPYKMGKCGGLAFLLVYLVLAVFVGFIIMISELALGRKTKLGPIGAYRKLGTRFPALGWLALLAPFLIMTFYSVLGGYCIYYIYINIVGIFAGMPDSSSFGTLLTNPLIGIGVMLLFMVICWAINKGGISGGIEKFNKIGMPALFVMLVIIIIRSVTLPNASEGLKFMFVPGYAVEGGFIEESPNFLSVLATAGGQMFFSLSLAMGIMITYGSYLDKSESLPKNAIVIVFSDTLVALMAGIAVIPAAVANGINSGMAVSDIKLGGPNLLFSTLQDVFCGMGTLGGLFGAIFYILVLIAAVSSAISLIEVIITFFIDRAETKGKEYNRSRLTTWTCVAIAVLACLVAADGLGSQANITPAAIFGLDNVVTWNDCWLDFMDCWSEGLAMPIGAMIMALVIGWEVGPEVIMEEVDSGFQGKLRGFYRFCIRFIVPVMMCLISAGQIGDFFGNQIVGYAISAALLLIYWGMCRASDWVNKKA